jgi:hypothetical protein
MMIRLPRVESSMSASGEMRAEGAMFSIYQPDRDTILLDRLREGPGKEPGKGQTAHTTFY